MNAIPLNSSLVNASATRGQLTDHDRLTATVQKWVGQTFFGTLLKQAHESPFKDQLFSGGRGGQAFGSMQDQMMAEHMSRGVGSKIVDSVVRRVEGKRAYEKAKAGERAKYGSRKSGMHRQQLPSGTPNSAGDTRFPRSAN